MAYRLFDALTYRRYEILGYRRIVSSISEYMNVYSTSKNH